MELKQQLSRTEDQQTPVGNCAKSGVNFQIINPEGSNPAIELLCECAGEYQNLLFQSSTMSALEADPSPGRFRSLVRLTVWFD